MSPEDLLAHSDFVRSLARSLVIDSNDAADVEQKTWLTALEHPPATPHSPRGWLSTVVRNFAVTLHRRENRRKKYEQASVRSMSMTTPEEIALRKEAIRQMTQAVLSLEEPYLSTIIMRFYEDMPVKDVAERLGMPLETVKTRIQRGLRILRRRLDNANGGSRKKWCLALAPLAGLKLTAGTAAAAGTAIGVETGSFGFLFMLAKLKVGIAAALLVGLSVTLYQLFPEAPVQEAEIPAASTAAPNLGDSGGGHYNALEGDEPFDRYMDRSDRVALAPSGLFCSGRVTDLETGAPVQVFDFFLNVCHCDEGAGDTHIHETVEDEEGRFSFSLEKGGPAYIRISSSQYRWKELWDIEISDEIGLTDLKIELDPGLKLSGRVVEDATNRPISNAIVGPAMYPYDTDVVWLRLLEFNEKCLHAVTDEEGRFTLSGLHRNEKKIAALHSDFAEGSVRVVPGSEEEVEIRLKSGYRIFGRAMDDEGKPAGDILIQVFGDELPTRRALLTDSSGRYRTPPLHPGRVFLKAGLRAWSKEEETEFTREHKVVDVVDSDLEVNFGPAEEYLTWRGILYGFDGEPTTSGGLMVVPADMGMKEARGYRLRRYAAFDEQGRFEVGKLLPGRYRVYWDKEGKSPFGLGIFTLENRDPIERDIDLSRGASISGVLVDRETDKPIVGKRGTVQAWQSTSVRSSYSTDIDEEGRFLLRGLTPGSYTLQAKVERTYSKRLIGVKVGKEEHLKGLKLEFFSFGSLRLRLEGFEESGGNIPFSLSLASGRTGLKYYYGTHRIKESGILEKTYKLGSGSWKASLAIEDLGYLERTFDISPDEATEVIVSRSEVYPHEGFVTLSGRITRPGGGSAEGIALRFTAYGVPRLPEDHDSLEAVTNGEGRYILEGFKPGRWKVSAKLSDGGWNKLPQLWIPPDVEGSFTYDLELQEGEVRGILFDKETGLAFSSGQPREWKVSLQDVARDVYLCNFQGGDGGNRFELKGLASGEYQLLVEAEGYEDFQTGAFHLEEGQALDLGDIQLKPCGLLDLEVVNGAFEPVGEYTVVCDGRNRYYDRMPDGKRRYDKLPLGLVTLTIKAKGYFEKSVEVRLEPARPMDAQVVLQPK